jgi:OFA family oxalate/formate antiporter-like MFS transporter
VATNATDLKPHAWWNVAIGFATWTLIVVMPASLMPTLYGPIMDDMGWGRGQVTLFSTFKFGAGAFICFFLGHIVDRFGLNRVMLTSMTVTGLAIASLFFVHDIVAYCAAAAVLGAAILGCITCTKVLISRWFSARLGFAIGLALTGAGLAGLIVPITATKLSASIGWRPTAAIMSATIFVILIPLYLWKARETPASFGATAEEIDPPAAARVEALKQDTSQQATFRDLLSMRTFWIVVIAQVLIGAVDHAMTDHLPLFLARDAKLGPEIAALGFSMMIVAGALGKLGFGWLFDRYSVKAVALCSLSMAVGILLAFPLTGPFAGVIAFSAFTLLRGASHGGVMVDIPIFSKHVFGVRTLAKTVAIFSAANSAGAAIAIGAIGYAHDALGSYTVSFIVLIVLAIVAAALVWRIEPKYWVRNAQRQQTKPLAVPVPASER